MTSMDPCESAALYRIHASDVPNSDCTPVLPAILAGLLSLLTTCCVEAADDPSSAVEGRLTAQERAVLPEPIEFETNLWHISCLAFSSDGRALAVAGLANRDGVPNPGLVKLLELPSGREVFSIHFPATLQDPESNLTQNIINEVVSLAFLPHGRTLATASHFGLQLWDSVDGSPIAALRADSSRRPALFARPLRSMAWSADGRRLATSDRDGVSVWDVPNRRSVLLLPCRGAGAVAFSHDGKVPAVTEGSALLRLWDVTTGRQLAEDRAQTGAVCSAAFTPDASILAVAVGSGTKLWPVRWGSGGSHTVSLGLPTELFGPFAHERRVVFSPDGKLLLTIDAAATLWDVATARPRATPDRSACCAAFSPDGKTLAVGGVDRADGTVNGQVRLWDVATVLQTNVIAAQAKMARLDLLEALEQGSGTGICSAMTAIGPYREAVIPWLVQALKNPRVADRGNVAHLLACTAPQANDLVPALIEASKDPSADVRSLVFLALSQLGSDARAAVPALIQSLKDPDSYARFNAAYALAEIGPAAMSELQAALEGDDSQLREAAGWALRAMGEDSVPALIQALTSRKPEVRMAAIQLLGSMGPKAATALPALKQAAADPDPGVREAASQAIERIQRQ